MKEKSNITNPSGIRFEEGTQSCAYCKSKEKIIQFEREIKRKGLPMVEIAFICEVCAKKMGYLDDKFSYKVEETPIPPNAKASGILGGDL